MGIFPDNPRLNETVNFFVYDTIKILLLLAVLIGIPLYSNAAGIIPLVSALTEKGMAMGTTLAFMMAVTGLSLPEFMILRKVMKARLILVFAGVVGAGIMLTGYLFNFVIK